MYNRLTQLGELIMDLNEKTPKSEPKKLSLEEIIEQLNILDNDKKESKIFVLNNEVYNPYSNTQKITFSSSSKEQK